MSRDQKVLTRHFLEWRRLGLLSPELETSLRRASDALVQQSSGGLVMKVLAGLGGSLLLAGAVLIVAENWTALPRAAKLGGWAGLQAAFLWLAWHFGRRWPDRPALAEATTLVASGWVLAGIALVSQIYQLSSRTPNGLWLWLALILPGVWVLRRHASVVAVFTALVSALAFEIQESGSLVEYTNAEGPWLWIGVPLLAAGLVSMLPPPTRVVQAWTGFWVFGVVTVCLLVLGVAQELDRSALGRAWWVAGAGLLFALARPSRCLPREWDATTSRVVLAAALLPWILIGDEYNPSTVDMVGLGLSWIAQLGIAVLVIRAGARAGADAWVNVGYLALLAGVMARYFDFFGNFLQGGAALLLTGVLMLFILYALEKARRRTLAREVRT